jgi:hypothetical protein
VSRQMRREERVRGLESEVKRNDGMKVSIRRKVVSGVVQYLRLVVHWTVGRKIASGQRLGRLV